MAAKTKQNKAILVACTKAVVSTSWEGNQLFHMTLVGERHLEGYFRFRAPDVEEGSRKLEDVRRPPESKSSPGRSKEAGVAKTNQENMKRAPPTLRETGWPGRGQDNGLRDGKADSD